MASAQAFLQSKEGYAGWDRFLGEAKVGHLKGLQLFFPENYSSKGNML